jgi:hypothetical protein
MRIVAQPDHGKRDDARQDTHGEQVLDESPEGGGVRGARHGPRHCNWCADHSSLLGS